MHRVEELVFSFDEMFLNGTPPGPRNLSSITMILWEMPRNDLSVHHVARSMTDVVAIINKKL